MTPRIHIQYSEYLDGPFKAEALSKYPGWKPMPENEVRDKAEHFAKLWGKIGVPIMVHIGMVTGLAFKRNYIPVYVVSGAVRVFSNPIVMKARFNDDEFLDAVLHELIHCLFVDNADSAFVKNADREYGNNHVALFAVMEYIRPGTVRKPEDLKNFPENARYLEAKDTVMAEGYIEILEKLRA